MMGRLFCLLSLGLALTWQIAARATEPEEVNNLATGTLLEESCQRDLSPDQLVRVGRKWEGKTVVLDTNVLLNDPMAMFKFPGAKVVISGTVLEEIDGKKNDDRLGRAARLFSRELLQLIERASDPNEISLGSNSKLVIDHTNYMQHLANTSLDRKKKDNELLAMAKAYSAKVGPENVFVITDDLNVRIKAFGLLVQARPFELDWVGPAIKEEGLLKTFEITNEQMETFLRDGKIPLPEALKIAPNEFVMFKSPGTEPSADTVGRFRFDREALPGVASAIVKLPQFKKSIQFPATPLNLEQAMALDLLIDPNVDCVVLEAKAGTGKTFLSMLTAFVLSKKYSRTYISRPTVFLGRNNPGALPGDINEKYSEWKKPFIDNYNMLIRNQSEAKVTNYPNGKKAVSGVTPAGFSPREELPKGFELLPFEFIRGRSLAYSLILIDEFQNTNVHEAKTILTRVGKGSKIIIMGDASQIDASPGYLNATNNGLSVAAAAYSNPDLSFEKRSRVGIVKLVEGVRSPFAELSAEVFERPFEGPK